MRRRPPERHRCHFFRHHLVIHGRHLPRVHGSGSLPHHADPSRRLRHPVSPPTHRRPCYQFTNLPDHGACARPARPGRPANVGLAPDTAPTRATLSKQASLRTTRHAGRRPRACGRARQARAARLRVRNHGPETSGGRGMTRPSRSSPLSCAHLAADRVAGRTRADAPLPRAAGAAAARDRTRTNIVHSV
jgi:hypothetical protein